MGEGRKKMIELLAKFFLKDTSDVRNAKENKMISLCFTEGLSSKIKKTDSLKGKTDDICTFCDFICTSCKK